MHVKKRDDENSDIAEIEIHDINTKDIYKPSPKILDIHQPKHRKLLKAVPSDIHILLPIREGNDFIIMHLGWTTLQKTNLDSNDVEGRMYSNVLPFHYNLLKDYCKKAVTSKKTIKLRLYYYRNNRIQSIVHTTILEDNGKLYIVEDYSSEKEKNKPRIKEDNDSRKLELIEYFSQTGSYYKYKNKYTWTSGIYNIINRTPEIDDQYYNIVFNLVVDEDQHKVEKLLNNLGPESPHIEEIIKIKTKTGNIKYLDSHVYVKFDENNEIISKTGFFKDISHELTEKNRSMDYLINGFIKNSKLALLIEPFSSKYSFSEGFYEILELDKQHDYKNNWKHIIENIKEKDIVQKINGILHGKINKLNETFTYYPNKSEENKKIIELSLESFYINNEIQHLGFLIDITKDIEKSKQLEYAKRQSIIIKEVHHRIKNNFQILNSFINIEKKVYQYKPELVIEHMQSRLQSLADLHNQTCKNGDFEILNLKTNIENQDTALNNLLSKNKDITFISNIEPDICLPISITTPIMLIINELTTNSIKHAFKNDENQEKIITKSAKLINNETCELIYTDNGKGIKKIENKEGHLGLNIIQSLTKQINGTLEINTPENGSRFKIIFPIKEDTYDIQNNKLHN